MSDSGSPTHEPPESIILDVSDISVGDLADEVLRPFVEAVRRRIADDADGEALSAFQSVI